MKNTTAQITIMITFLLGLGIGGWVTTIIMPATISITDCTVIEVGHERSEFVGRMSCTVDRWEEVIIPIRTADDIVLIQSSQRLKVDIE